MYPGHTVLPFTALSWPKFEAFIFEALSSGLRVEVPASRRPRRAAATRRVIRAVHYGGPGYAQRGIDFVATMDDGSDWLFQAKLTPKFGLTKAKAAVKKARGEFPNATRCFLVVSGTPTVDAIEYVRHQSGWEMWDGAMLTALFLRGISIQQQIEIVGRAWPAEVSHIVSQLYPLRDSLLVTAEEFFATWTKPERLFHHRSALVGHADILTQLSVFLRDPVHRACILVAPGGRGKSRLLRAFAEFVGKNHPDFQTRFVDPHAPATARPESLRAENDTQFVVVQDDAHRAETIRPDLLALLAGTKGKILLATRPQAVAALEQRLVQTGFSAHTIRQPLILPKLKLTEYEQLARAELDAAYRHHTRFLARMGRDCPLVITVGAALINKNLVPADKFEDKIFQTEVFTRFEGEELDQLGAQFPRDLLRRILQAIAVLAPWLEQKTDAKTVASFVGCTEIELRSVVAQLEAGQLVVNTGRGRRVVPDLFADHLVYSACYQANGSLSGFANELAKVFAAKASETMLRNLSEADWQAVRYHQNPASLIEPFWESLWKLFQRSDFFERSLILERWGAHSVYQPERSLALAQLALDLKRAPAPADKRWMSGESGQSLYSHRRVLSQVPGMLEPIAIWHEGYRERCLDFLLELAAVWPTDASLEDHNHPWAVIARVAEFKLDHPITAAGGVLLWIEENLNDPRFRTALETPSKILAKILGPVFARYLDASYSEGNTIHFSHPPIIVKQTEHLRDHAFRIIERQIIPRGEIATLNVLPVLCAGMDSFRGQRGSQSSPQMKRRWQPERLKALAVVERLVAGSPSKRVRWKVRGEVRSAMRFEARGSTLRRRFAALLGMLPLDGDILEVAAFCSSGWQEFEERVFERCNDASGVKDEIDEEWRTVLGALALNLIARTKSVSVLVGLLEAEIAACVAVGFTDQSRALLTAIGAANLSVAKSVVDYLLVRNRSSLAGSWCSFIVGSVRYPDPWLEKISLRVLASKSAPLISSLLDFVHSAAAGPIPPKILLALGGWTKRATEAHANLVIGALNRVRSPDDPVWHAVASNLNLKKLTDSQVGALVESVGRSMRYREVEVSDKFTRDLLREMVRMAELESGRSSDFRHVMDEKDPCALFKLYFSRLHRNPSEREKYQPMPTKIGPFTRFSQAPDHAKLAHELFRRMRYASREERFGYEQLFRFAVVKVSALGAQLLLGWANSARSMDELHRIAGLLRFDGSLVLLKQPELAVALLKRGRELKPQEFPQWEMHLAGTIGPSVRSYSDGVRKPEEQYVATEANELLSAGKANAALQAFYRAVLKRETGIATSVLPANDDDV